MGEDSYVITEEGQEKQEAHRSQLSPYTQDDTAISSFPLYYFSGKEPEVEPVLGPGEYVPESIMASRESPDGRTQYEVKLRGCDSNKNTWESVSALLNPVLLEYLQSRNLMLQEKSCAESCRTI